MTITLDDMPNLLHLPIVGQFYTHHMLHGVGATNALVELFGVTHENASNEIDFCRGAHVRLSWLREVYENACTNRQWTIVARAYLLHLVGGTIYVDKSATLVNVSYLGLFVDLRMTGGYSWAKVALTHLYEQLGDSSYASTRQLGGYATLLQVSLIIL